MSHYTKRKSGAELLDETIAGIAAERPSAGATEDAARRVWSRIAAATRDGVTARATLDSEAAGVASRGECREFQNSIPLYLRGALTPERELLFKDHTSECVVCRRALRDARSGKAPAARAHRAAPSAPRALLFPAAVARTAPLRIAAAILLACVLVGWLAWRPFGRGGLGATVEAAEGELLRVDDVSVTRLAPGAGVAPGATVRTAKDSRALLRLPDGSSLEIDDRAQLSVSETGGAAAVNLERGNVILRSTEGGAPLSVRTPGATITTRGGIVAVASGTLGARASVIAGAAQIETAGASKNLRAGEQAASGSNLNPSAPAADVAWSRDADEYRRLLARAAAVGNEIDRRAAPDAVRRSTRLLDLAPRGTIFYAGLPNAGTTLAESYELLQTRLNENPALAAWWQKNHKGDRADVEFMMERLRGWGARLGSEIAVSAEASAAGEPARPLVLAEVRGDEAEFRRFVESELGEILTHESEQSSPRDRTRDGRQKATRDGGSAALDVRFIDDPAAIARESGAGDDILFAVVRGGIFAASPSIEAVRAVASRIDATDDAARDPFRERIADVYRDGTNFVLAADLAGIRGSRTEPLADNLAAALHRTGFDDLRYLVIEAREAGDPASRRIENRLTVDFSGERRGVAAWLAAPHAMGAIDFVSPEASVAAAFVMQEPGKMLDDVLGTLGAIDKGLVDQLAEAQGANNISLQDDLAAPLGGEFAFAIDGPVLPVPSWKLIVEVYDPVRLQATMRRVIEEANRRAQGSNRPGIELTTVESGGRSFHTLKSAAAPVEISYTFADGYAIFAPSRALVERALETRASGVTLRQAPRFRAALPHNSDANFSALFYQNLAGVFDSLAPLADRLGDQAADGSQRAADIARRAPALAYAQAYADRIVVSAPTEGAPFGLTPGALLGLPGGSGLGEMLGDGTRSQ